MYTETLFIRFYGTRRTIVNKPNLTGFFLELTRKTSKTSLHNASITLFVGLLQFCTECIFKYDNSLLKCIMLFV